MIDVSPELLAFLKEEYDRCQDSVLEEDRENAIDRYNGEPYGDEEEGSSQIVSRATMEVIDYMVPSILRTIVAGERVVEFIHRDSEKAHEATETIMYLLMDAQDGFNILQDWLKSGLLEKSAVAMTSVQDGQPKRRLMQGVAAIELPMLEQQGYKIIEATPTGEEDGAPVFTVTAIEESPVNFFDAAVPNEEFYCSVDARTLDEAAMKGRKVRKTLSDLVAAGFPFDEVEEIGSGDYSVSTVSDARNEDRFTAVGQRKGAARVVWWHEEFVRFDANGDGIAELLYIQRSTDFKIFAVDEMEEYTDHPFEDWCPFPMPHRRIGQSLADKVMDLERIETVIMRQSLDGVYLSNNPSTYLHEDSISKNTVEDLLTVKPGRIVRWHGAIPPQERTGAFDLGTGLSMMDRLERMRETRTGITRLNMGLDADTLNQTATGQGQLIARGEQQEEYVARNFANAFAKLITKKARLLQRFGKPIWVPINGKYTQVDPRNWPEDMIARARMGLGVVNKDQRISYRREIIAMQAQALQAGLSIVDENSFFNSAKGFVNEIDIGDASEFFVEPPKDDQGNPLPKQEQPDPAMAQAQAEMQMRAQDQQFRQQEAAAKLQAMREESAARLELSRAEAQAQAQLARDKAQAEGQLARENMAAEYQLKRELMAMEAAMRDDVGMTQHRPGGDLDK